MVFLQFNDSDGGKVVAPVSSIVRIVENESGHVGVVFIDDELVSTGARLRDLENALEAAGVKLVQWS
jgi:predicted amidophosphoribosyltransferase